MGWCSGTPIFDAVYGYINRNSNIPQDEKIAILKVLTDAMEDHDWDCQDDSKYAGKVLWEKVMKELHPDWDWSETE